MKKVRRGRTPPPRTPVSTNKFLGQTSDAYMEHVKRLRGREKASEARKREDRQITRPKQRGRKTAEDASGLVVEKGELTAEQKRERRTDNKEARKSRELHRKGQRPKSGARPWLKDAKAKAKAKRASQSQER